MTEPWYRSLKTAFEIVSDLLAVAALVLVVALTFATAYAKPEIHFVDPPRSSFTMPCPRQLFNAGFCRITAQPVSIPQRPVKS